MRVKHPYDERAQRRDYVDDPRYDPRYADPRVNKGYPREKERYPVERYPVVIAITIGNTSGIGMSTIAVGGTARHPATTVMNANKREVQPTPCSRPVQH